MLKRYTRLIRLAFVALAFVWVSGGCTAPIMRMSHVQVSTEKSSVFPDKSKIDAVIFDMDGTLLDSLSAWEHASANYLRTRGIELPPDAEARLEHMSLMEGANYLIEIFSLPDTPEELIAATVAPVRERYMKTIQPKPGVPELLKRLHAQGIKIAVATAANTDMARGAFTRTRLLPYFEFMIDCNEVGAGKGSPKIYEEALKRLGTTKERTLVVEDALYALQTAEKAGFLTAGIADAHYDEAYEAQVKATGDYFFTSFEDSLKGSKL